jgi:phosphonate transport system permease protein
VSVTPVPPRAAPVSPTTTGSPPPRLRRPPVTWLVVLAVVVGFVVHGTTAGAVVTPQQLLDGIGRTGDFLAEAFPPDFGRIDSVLAALVETFEMALLGTIIGVTLSIPLAFLAARTTSPNRVVYAISRAVIGFFRTIPDLVWGLIFVVTVGLGPAAGVLAIAMDTTGFCGRFFADSIEDVDPGLPEGLEATGAGNGGILAGAIVPSVLPSWVGTSMFALESATRSSVVLGIVGAGGIGVELTTSMQLLRYDEALTIILCIFVAVLAVERTASALRKRIR